MNIHLPPGAYIVAVSGGVDSVVLLDMLSKLPDLNLIVAHVDHGIRPESHKDAEFVKNLATAHKYPYEQATLELGADASEDTARTARYTFLLKVQQNYHADAIITAHHQDDVIETAILNMLRGTGRRGLTSLDSKDSLLRPLLDMPKSALLAYAHEQQLAWVEDSTNQQSVYLRNHIRNDLLVSASQEWKQSFLSHISSIKHVNHQLDRELVGLLSYKIRGGRAVVARDWFVRLEHVLACECMYALLRKLQVKDIDSAMVERLTIGLKTARPGSKIDINGDLYALITKRSMRFIDRKNHKTVAL